MLTLCQALDQGHSLHILIYFWKQPYYVLFYTWGSWDLKSWSNWPQMMMMVAVVTMVTPVVMMIMTTVRMVMTVVMVVIMVMLDIWGDDLRIIHFLPALLNIQPHWVKGTWCGLVRNWTVLHDLEGQREGMTQDVREWCTNFIAWYIAIQYLLPVNGFIEI